MANWQPSASQDVLVIRAKLLANIRQFFNQRDILEVETPVLSRFANVDPMIDSFDTQQYGEMFYLHTSPEFFMKRLLSAGYGSIYQIAKVFRQEEVGRYHNPEFSLLEWYHVDIDEQQLMQEVVALIYQVSTLRYPVQMYRYQQLFLDYFGIDPLNIDVNKLSQIAQKTINFVDMAKNQPKDKDFWLHLLFSHGIERHLGQQQLTFVYDYPASQASLAKIDETKSVAKRFELYINGIELANGFSELQDAEQQRQRFQHDLYQRQQSQKPLLPYDQCLLDALTSGLPECSGVALGLDRLLMIMTQSQHIRDVMSFAWERV